MNNLKWTHVCCQQNRESCKVSASFQIVSRHITHSDYTIRTLLTELKPTAQQQQPLGEHTLKESYTSYTRIQTSQIQTGTDHHQRPKYTTVSDSECHKTGIYYTLKRRSYLRKITQMRKSDLLESVCCVCESVMSQPARPVPSGITNILVKAENDLYPVPFSRLDFWHGHKFIFTSKMRLISLNSLVKRYHCINMPHLRFILHHFELAL